MTEKPSEDSGKMEELLEERKKAIEDLVASMTRLKKTIEEAQTEISLSSSKLEEKYYLLWGLGMGLTLGIIGNLMAGHWIEVLRGITPADIWWLANTICFAISLIGLLVFITWMSWRMRKISISLKLDKQILQRIDKMNKLFEEAKERGLLD